MTSKYYAQWEADKEEREDSFVHERVQKAVDNGELVITKRGVFKNLTLSPYSLKVNNRELKFSSMAKLAKYEKEVAIKIAKLENTFKRLHGKGFDLNNTHFKQLCDNIKLVHYNKMKLK